MSDISPRELSELALETLAGLSPDVAKRVARAFMGLALACTRGPDEWRSLLNAHLDTVDEYGDDWVRQINDRP